MSDSESEKAASSEDENKHSGQYDDDDAEEERGEDKEENDSDEGPARRRRPKKEQRSKRSRFIDDAAEESDDQGGTRDNDDDEDEDEDEEEEEEDVRRPGRKRARNKFIVDDEEEEEVAKKEKITITEREKRLDREDYELISANTGMNIVAPDDVDDEDDDDDEEDDAQTKTRRRVHQSGRVAEEDAVRKTTKKGFERLLGNVEAEASSMETQNRRQRDAYIDESDDDSMDDFIDQDIPDDERGPSHKKRMGGSSQRIPVQRHDLALSLMGDEVFSDEEYQQQTTAEIDDKDPYKNFEPEVQKQRYMTKQDIQIRQIDEPERLQIDLKDRIPVSSVNELREEAEWMLSQLRCKASELIEDVGDEREVFVHPVTKEKMEITKSERAHIVQGQLIDKIVNVLSYFRGVENEDIQHGPITIEEVDANGPEALGDSEEVQKAEWLFVGPEDPTAPSHGWKRAVTAKLDVPFIARYRQEYWRDELDAADLWKIYDLDGKYSAFRKRKEWLVERFRGRGDAEGAEKAERANGDEEISDVAAYFEVRHAQGEKDKAAAAEEAASGRKAPVRRTRYQMCEAAKLGEMVRMFTITPEQLSANIENSSLLHQPETPSDDPTSVAIDRVPHAENYGFRDAEAVLKGVRYMAAKQLATEPSIRDMVRNHLAPRARVTVTMTRKGEDSAEMYHRPLALISQKMHHHIDEETLLQLIKARDEGLVKVQIRMSDDDHRNLLESFRELFLAPENAAAADGADEDAAAAHSVNVAEWNRLRTAILEEALQEDVYVFFEAELLNIRARFAKELVLQKCQEKLEGMLRVAPYSWSRDQDSKAERPNRIMAVTYGEPTEFVVIDALGEVVEYLSIQLRVSANANQPMAPADRNRMVEFVQRAQPDVLVVGARELRCRTLKRQLEELVNHCQTLGHLQRQIDVLYADQAVALRYAHSERAMQEFPKYPPARMVAVSLARRLQDPLREMAGLCAGVTDDVLSLQLHPLQDMLDKGERRKYLHRAFVNVVNEVGVDINLAVDKQLIHGHTLQFVSGLGPRKATELLQVLKQTGCVQYRMQLLQDETVRATGMRNVVWTNAVGFFRITTNSSSWNSKFDIGQDLDEDDQVVMAGGGPIEGTRIHPEAYKLANKIANDAFEEDEDEDPADADKARLRSAQMQRTLRTLRAVMRPENFKMLDVLDLEAYADLIRQDLGLKHYTLADIVKELKAPFADPRPTDRADVGDMRLRAWELTWREQFNLLTLSGDRVETADPDEVRRLARLGREPPPPTFVSTLIGTAVHVRVVHLFQHKPRDDGGYHNHEPPQPEPPYKLKCLLENGLTGFLDRDRFGDDDDSGRLFAETVRVDQVIQCVIVGVEHKDFCVELSHRSRDLQKADGMAGVSTAATAARRRKEAAPRRPAFVPRAIQHPNFQNIGRDKALELLQAAEPGEFVIRPSSQGTNMLSITRKVYTNIYVDMAVEMFEQPNALGVGRSLVVNQRRFEDLDELVISYLEPIAAHERKLLGHDKFHAGPADDIREKLRREKTMPGAARGVPYLLGFNPAKPGAFVIFYLPGASTVMEDGFYAVPEGFRCDKTNHRTINDLLNWWKGHAAAKIKAARGGPPPGGGGHHHHHEHRPPHSSSGYAGSGTWSASPSHSHSSRGADGRSPASSSHGGSRSSGRR